MEASGADAEGAQLSTWWPRWQHLCEEGAAQPRQTHFRAAEVPK